MMPAMRILVVEDDAIILSAICASLTKLGYAVVETASAGAEALRKAAAARPDLVLMDIHLGPGMDGVEAADQIRARFDLPVVYLTADTDAETLRRAEITEPFGYLIKPFRECELQAAIEMAFYKHKTETELQHYRDRLEELVATRTAALRREIAERKQAETALQASKRQIESILESISDGFFTLNAAWQYTYLNANAARMVGKTAADLLDKCIWEEFPEAVKSPFYAIYHDVMANKQAQSFQVHYPPLDKWFEGTAYPYAEGISVYYRDITERKRAEFELEDYRRYLEELVNVRTAELQQEIIEHHKTEETLRIKERAIASSMNAIALADLAGNVTYVNPAFRTLWGYADENEVLGKPAIDFWQIKARAAEIVMALQQERGWSGELVAQRKDGTMFTAQLSASLVADETGRPLCLMAAFIDVTEHQRAEHELRETRDYLENLLDYANAPIIVWDPKFRITRFNRAFERLTGYNAAQVLGRPLDMLFPAAQRADSLSYIQRTAHGERWESVEIAIRCCDDVVRTVLWNSATLYAPDGNTVLATIAQGQDITARKQAEEALQKAKERAEAANQAKSAFLAGMSHELRTPLNGILGYAQILKRDPALTESQRDGVTIIEQSGTRLLSLIIEILDMAKIEARKVELHPTAVDFSEFSKGITAIIQLRAQQKGLAFHYEPAADLPAAILADEQRLKQVLLNLLNNAVKFTDRGSVTFRVKRLGNWGDGEIGRWRGENISSLLHLSPIPHLPNSPSPYLPISPTPYLRFEVADTGMGIPADRLTEIFAPFGQVSDYLHKTDGAGLGLASSQQLAQLMGGTITVESALNQGSTFWFEAAFPEVDPALATTLTPQAQIIGYTALEGTPAGVKILIVDDNADNRAMLRDMLRPLGFEIREASGGQECVDVTRAWRPALILLDLMMPGIDGFEAARQIRTMATGDGQRALRPIIIAVSANVLPETQQQIFQAGCDDFLPKPVRFESLSEKLQTHLELQWRYAPPVDLPDTGAGLPPSEPLRLPPRTELDALYDLANMGDIMGVVEAAAALQDKDPEYAPFAARLMEFRKTLQITQLCEFLERFLVDNPSLKIEGNYSA